MERQCSSRGGHFWRFVCNLSTQRIVFELGTQSKYGADKSTNPESGNLKLLFKILLQLGSSLLCILGETA